MAEHKSNSGKDSQRVFVTAQLYEEQISIGVYELTQA